MDVLIIPLAAMAIPIVIAPFAIGFRYSQRVREMEHVERMRALELGRVLPQDQGWWTPSRIVALIAGLVPIVSMGVAATANGESGFREEIWMACGAVGVSGVIGGTIIARRYLFGATQLDAATVKPQYDPDTLDVVGSRG